jgi:hypothetical protein
MKKVVPKTQRPKWVGLHKIFEGHETEVFKNRFTDWDLAVKVDWQSIRNGI